MAAVKKPLLEIVQSIMSELSMDNVNQIQDSSEAMQVASIVEDAFYDSVTTRHWPHLHQMLVMEDTDNSVLRPTHLRLPEGIQEAARVQYNIRKTGDPDVDDQWEDITYLIPEKFLSKVKTYKTSADNVQIVTLHSGVRIPVKTDYKPTAWTSFDDEWIVFDSWNNDLDTTIHTYKCWCHGVIMPSFTQADDFVMDMPVDAQRQIISDAKSRVSLSILGKANTKAEQSYQRNERWLSRKAWRASGGIQYATYGRKGRSSRTLSPYLDRGPWKPK